MRPIGDAAGLSVETHRLLLLRQSPVACLKHGTTSGRRSVRASRETACRVQVKLNQLETTRRGVLLGGVASGSLLIPGFAGKSPLHP
jgi:hypothetical protein